MLVIEIDNREYECPQSWADVTLRRYCDSVEVLNSMPKKLHTFTFGKQEDREKIEITNDDSLTFASFYKKWVAFWCDIPEAIVSRLPLESEDGIGVINLYNELLKFMVMPKQGECKPLEVMEYKGVKYMMPESIKMLNGETQPMSGASFDEFCEGVELKGVQSEIKSGNAKVLPLLTAIIYRPAITIRKGFLRKIVGYKIESYDSARVKERASFFSELPMDKVWGAYFFFIQSRLLLLKNTLQSSREEVARQAMSVSMDGI